MSYPKQLSVLAAMEYETRKSQRIREERDIATVLRSWDGVKRSIRGYIRETYASDFASRRWSLAEAKVRGTLLKIDHRVRQEILDFKTFAKAWIRNTAVELYDSEKRRAAWMLDQTTPPWIRVDMALTSLREAEPNVRGMVRVFSGEEAVRRVQDRFDAWLDAYGTVLMRNIELGAINESSADNAADETEATRVGTPAIDMAAAIDRLVTTAYIDTEALARSDFADENADIIAAEIWQTMEDADVCPICDPNNGLEREEADDDIPAHPNCRCYWRLVPRAWLELMRAGDPELARELEDRGFDERSMAIRDPKTGAPAAFMTIRFDSWSRQVEEQLAAQRGGLA